MSEDYTPSQPFPAGQPYGTQGAAAELQSVLDRVKDERLRLLRLLKDCETRFGTMGVVPPAEEIARLTGKVRAIDDAVRNRYTQLRHDETLLEKRSYQVDQLRDGVQELADQLNVQIEQARTFKPELAAAKQAVQAAMEQIVQDARTQLNLLGDNVADRLGEFRHAQTSGHEQLRETRQEIEKVFTDIDSRLAAAAGLARDEAQKLIDPIFGQLENHATECGQRIHQIIEAADNTVREKLEALPAQAQKSLGPAKETLDAVIEDAHTHIASVNEAIQSLDSRVLAMTDQTECLIQQQLDSLSQRADQVLESQLEQRLNAHLRTIDTRLEEAINTKQQELIQTLDERGNALTDQLIARQREETDKVSQTLAEIWDSKASQASAKAGEAADKLLAELRARVDTEIGDASDRAEKMGQQIHGQLTASLDQSHAEAIEATRKIEAEAKGISETADQRAAEVARAIERSMREHVVEAMSRADAITDPFKARLEDALSTHRQLADEFSTTAEAELSGKAKAHWDAFRRDTQAALEKQKQILEDQARATIDATQQHMKQRVQELCVSSQSMVDLIEQQLTRKLKGVQPQAQQAMEAIEKQTGERLSQLRENAQSMVQLVEDQLGKRVAELHPNTVSAAREAERELNEHMDRVRQEVENIIVPLRRQAIEELSQIADVGKSVRGAIKREQATQANTTEPPVVDASRLTSPLHEMATRMGKKAAKLVSTSNAAEPIPGQTQDQDNSDDDRKAA